MNSSIIKQRAYYTKFLILLISNYLVKPEKAHNSRDVIMCCFNIPQCVIHSELKNKVFITFWQLSTFKSSLYNVDFFFCMFYSAGSWDVCPADPWRDQRLLPHQCNKQRSSNVSCLDALATVVEFCQLRKPLIKLWKLLDSNLCITQSTSMDSEA